MLLHIRQIQFIVLQTSPVLLPAILALPLCTRKLSSVSPIQAFVDAFGGHGRLRNHPAVGGHKPLLL